MKKRYMIAVAAFLLAVCGMTLAQQPKIGLTPAGGAGAVPPPDDPAAQLLPQGKPAKPEDMTIDQLLDAVEKFREQKAEIEKKEKAYMKVVHQKAEKLKQRIDNLDGVTTPPVINSTTSPPPVSIPGPSAFPPAPMP